MDKEDIFVMVSAVLIIASLLGVIVLFMWAGYTDATSHIAEQCDRRGEIVLEGYVYNCERIGRE